MIKPDIDKLASIKEHFEGYSTTSYKDTGGIWTIGYGSTYNHTHNRRVREGDVISRDTAKKWMNIDITELIRQLNMYIKKPLNEYQSAAIVDYVYNRGINNFLKTSIDDLINIDPSDPRILNEILGTGLKDRAGNLLWGLGRRRRAEAHLYSTGILKFDWKRW